MTAGFAWGMQTIHEAAALTLEQAAETALEGEMSQAVSQFRQAQQRWERYQRLSATVADHSPMDEIEMLFAEAEVYARQQNTVYFSASCAHLSRLVRAMSDAHQLTWWNLL